MKPLSRLQAFATFLESAFGAPKTKSREQALVRAQAVLLVLEKALRADLALEAAEADALAEALEAMTGTGAKLAEELAELVPLPTGDEHEQGPAVARGAPVAVEVKAEEPAHVPGTNGAAAAYTRAAAAAVEPSANA